MLCCIAQFIREPDSSDRLQLRPLRQQQQNRSSHAAFHIQDLPQAALARVLSYLPFASRCQAAVVCSSWNSIIRSAAAHEASDDAATASSPDWALTRTAPYDVCADGDLQQQKLHVCPTLRHASSAAVWLCSAGLHTLQQLGSVTRLQLLDPRIDLEHSLRARPACKTAASLQHLQRLRVLNLVMARPIVDLAILPSSLQCLHLNLSSGFSVALLHQACHALAASAPALPALRHISIGLELDALLSHGRGSVLSPLSGLTQLTSLALADYQHLHPDAPAHEGYAAVPPVLQQLPGLQHVELRLCSGHRAELAAVAAVPQVSLALTLARHEQVQFNRLPPSITAVTGLTSLSLLMAEFDYEDSSQLCVFDASPLAQCRALRSLLLELHGSKSCQHDLRGLAQLSGLDELVVLFKCPDVHEARPEAQAGSISSGSAGSAGLDAPAAWEQPGLGMLGAWLSNYHATSSSKAKKSRGVFARLARAMLGWPQGESSQLGEAAVQQQQAVAAAAVPGSSASVLLDDEWILQLLDAALDRIRPEYALSVPRVSGRLLIATTGRLLLRQSDNIVRAGQPMLVAAHLQLDGTAAGDAWSGESFLQQRGPRELASWAARSWLPSGVALHAAARYPSLGNCGRRLDDKLLTAARVGVSGGAVVAALMEIVEERCLTYFY